MKELIVSIEILGKQIPAGVLSYTSHLDAVFRYNSEYMTSYSPISLSLPFQDMSFTTVQTRNFFDGLLPEGFTRRALSSQLHFSEDDYISLLSVLGSECLGAIRIGSAEPTSDDGYEKVSMDQVKALAEEGTSKSTEILTKTHLSLTGASGKVGLLLKGDEWFLPHGNAPSTHILKQSHVRLDSIVINEQLSMLTARNMGIDTPDSFILNVGDGSDSSVLFASERYDRIIEGNSRTIDGIKCPLRLHQEDFAQALGISATEKYEHDPQQHYLKKMFSLVRNSFTNPMEDQIKLWDMIIFNYLLGNTDGHIKNFSMIYDSSLHSIRLAPAYDMVCTCAYESSTENMAFSIGGRYGIHSIDRSSFAEEAQRSGFADRLVLKRFDRLADQFEESLDKACLSLKDLGFNNTDKMKDRILASGGYNNL